MLARGRQKKLIDVARAWAGPRDQEPDAPDAALSAQAAGLNIPPDMLAAMQADATLEDEARDDGPIEIMPPNADACRLFFAMDSQWRTAVVSIGPQFMIVKTALDYAALPAVTAAIGLVLDEPMLGRLKVLEDEAVIALAERRA